MSSLFSLKMDYSKAKKYETKCDRLQTRLSEWISQLELTVTNLQDQVEPTVQSALSEMNEMIYELREMRNLVANMEYNVRQSAAEIKRTQEKVIQSAKNNGEF